MGHPSTQRTYDLLRVKYWWPNMVTDIKKYNTQAKVLYTLFIFAILDIAIILMFSNHLKYFLTLILILDLFVGLFNTNTNLHFRWL